MLKNILAQQGMQAVTRLISLVVKLLYERKLDQQLQLMFKRWERGSRIFAHNRHEDTTCGYRFAEEAQYACERMLNRVEMVVDSRQQALWYFTTPHGLIIGSGEQVAQRETAQPGQGVEQDQG